MQVSTAASPMTDPSASEALLQRLGSDLRAFVARRVQPEHVDDVLQDVLLKVHRGLPSVTEDERILGWVYRVARNVVTDHHRRYRSSDTLDVEAMVAEEPEPSDAADVARTVASWLVPTIATLPNRHRQALELVELGGMTQKELAGRLELSASGARTRVQRARAALREKILRCCEIELDARGAVIDYRRRSDDATVEPEPECCG